MATGTIKGVAKGTAHVKVSYGGLVKDISGTVNVVTVSNAGGTLSLTRTRTLSSITATDNVQYYIVNGTFTYGTGNVTATYTANSVTGTISCAGFKNTPTVSVASNNSNNNVTASASALSSGNSTITVTVSGAAAADSTITIKDGTYTITTVKVTSAAVTTSVPGLTATGLSTSNTSISGTGSYITTGTTNRVMTAKAVGTQEIYAYYTDGSVTKYDSIGTQYVGSVSVSPTTVTRARTISDLVITDGSDDVSVLVGSTVNYTKPTSVVAKYTITSASAGDITISQSGFNSKTPTFSAVTASGGTTASTLFTVSGTKISDVGTTAGTAYVRGTVDNKYINGLNIKITVSNPVISEDVTNSVTYSSSDTTIMTVS